MEYFYIAMLLQELGKEISAANIQKILAALDMEADNVKIQFLVSALSVLAAANGKKPDKAAEEPSFQQLTVLQKRFDILESSVAAVNEKLTSIEREQAAAFEDCLAKGNGKEAVLTGKTAQPGRYVYGIAGKGVREHLGAIGLDGADVYTIPYKDMCVVVHDCPAEPYKSEDEGVVKEWLFTQQEVMDIAAEKYGGVLPMSFDMIIEGKDGSDPGQAAIMWLEKNYDNFMGTITRIRNKQEFGIQVILDTRSLSEKLFETDEKLRARKKEIDARPEGIAYMERELLKDLVKERIEGKADSYFKEFYGMIKKYTDDIVIGKVKKVGGNQQMLMNLSCLVRKDMVAPLGEELEKIKNNDGISVRFSGPWAPYSFVTPEKGVLHNGDAGHE